LSFAKLLVANDGLDWNFDKKYIIFLKMKYSDCTKEEPYSCVKLRFGSFISDSIEYSEIDKS